MEDPGINGKHDITDITEHHQMENPGSEKQKPSGLCPFGVAPDRAPADPSRDLAKYVYHQWCVCVCTRACVSACVRSLVHARPYCFKKR